MKNHFKLMVIYLLISSPCFSITKEVIINESFNGSNPNTCYNRSLMNATMGENINYDDIFIQRQDILSKAHKRTTTHPIPKISHHIWITNANNPKEINAKNIDHIKKTFKFISQDKLVEADLYPWDLEDSASAVEALCGLLVDSAEL